MKRSIKSLVSILLLSHALAPAQAQGVWSRLKQKLNDTINNSAGPSQNGYPSPGGYPAASGNPNASGYPNPGGYPAASGNPNASGYPNPGGYPNPMIPAGYPAAMPPSGNGSSSSSQPLPLGVTPELWASYTPEQQQAARNAFSSIPHNNAGYDKMMEDLGRRTPLPPATGDYLTDRRQREAIQAMTLHLNPGAELYDPGSCNAEHYVKYNNFLSELAKHGYISAEQAQAEIHENQAKFQLLARHSLKGIDPAMIAKWRPDYYIRSYGTGKFGGVEHGHMVILHWAPPGSNDTREWNLTDDSGNFGPGVREVWSTDSP